jgi:hypothetical protein
VGPQRIGIGPLLEKDQMKRVLDVPLDRVGETPASCRDRCTAPGPERREASPGSPDSAEETLRVDSSCRL